MTFQTINLGSAPNDGTGDDLRTAGGKINTNFDLLFSKVDIDLATTEAAGLMSAADKAKLDIALTETSGEELTAKAASVAADEVLIFDSEDGNAPKLVPAGTFAAALLSQNAQTGAAYTLGAGDAGCGVTMASDAANTVTIPAGDAIPVGAVINVVQTGAGATTVTGAAGVSVNGATAGSVTIAARWQGVSLWKVGADAWVASGAFA